MSSKARITEEASGAKDEKQNTRGKKYFISP